MISNGFYSGGALGGSKTFEQYHADNSHSRGFSAVDPIGQLSTPPATPTDTRRDLIALTVRHGARTPIGHRASPLSGLVMLQPENPAHASRIARIAARLTAELGSLVAAETRTSQPVTAGGAL